VNYTNKFCKLEQLAVLSSSSRAYFTADVCTTSPFFVQKQTPGFMVRLALLAVAALALCASTTSAFSSLSKGKAGRKMGSLQCKEATESLAICVRANRPPRDSGDASAGWCPSCATFATTFEDFCGFDLFTAIQNVMDSETSGDNTPDDVSAIFDFVGDCPGTPLPDFVFYIANVSLLRKPMQHSRARFRKKLVSVRDGR
jgi:hypothetical protein